jgi:phosphoribosylglycinamide formyltransferase-1
VPILPGESERELHERIKVVERDLLVETVLAIAENKITLSQFSKL